MSVHAYPRSAAVADLARVSAGLALAGLPMLLVDTAPVVTGLLALIIAVFAAYGWSPAMSDEEILAKLLQLNLARAME